MLDHPTAAPGRSPGLDQTAVRRVNTGVVLQALAGSDGLATLQGLVARTGLSRRTVEVIVADLMADRWAVEEEAGGGGGAGRPARRFRFAADRVLVAGVRIETHTTQAVVADLTGAVRGRATRVLGEDYFDPRRTSRLAADAVEEALHASGAGRGVLAAGAIAAGGVVEPDTGVVRRLVNAPAWTGFGLADALRARIDVPWIVDNDANLAALAEHRDGAATGYRHVAWLSHGRRTGAGFILGGALHRGAGGTAGELIESRVLDLPLVHGSGIGGLTSPVAQDREQAARLVADARAGDPGALADAGSLADEIASVVDVLAWTVAPELVVLGGGLEQAADVLIPLVQARIRALGDPDVQLAPSRVGRDAPLLGAVRQALDLVAPGLHDRAGAAARLPEGTA